jgi:hypothetical protein
LFFDLERLRRYALALARLVDGGHPGSGRRLRVEADAGAGPDSGSDSGPSSDGAVDLAKVADTPDYLQSDPAFGGFPEAGSNYCAPAAVSNALMWLSDNGFPKIAPTSGDPKHDEYDLIVTLASPTFMDTDPNSGTDAAEVCSGLGGFLSSVGYSYDSLSYEGWRTVDAAFDSGVHVPTLASIQQGIQGMGSVWLNIGWYTHDSSNDTWTRTGGHWVTVVGYGYDGTSDDPRAVVLHDPFTTTLDDYADLVPLESGTLAGDYTGLPRSAAGYFQMTGPDYYESQGGIVDGIVVLEMPGG